MEGFELKLRILHFAGIFALALALAACGQDAGTGNGTDEGDDTLAGFEPNVPEVQEAEETPGMDDAPVSQETGTMLPAFAYGETPQNATSAMSFDGDDLAEDLYRRGLYQEAISRWQEEADAGSAYAAYRIGVEYFDAKHVERDIPLAARYQQLASELGSAPAMFELASFYEGGFGVPYDLDLSGQWFLESARRGYPPAQHNVATMFEEGAGQPRDLVRAYLYYGLAIEQGFEVNFVFSEETGRSTLVDPRDRLREMMSEDEVAEADALIENFEMVE